MPFNCQGLERVKAGMNNSGVCNEYSGGGRWTFVKANGCREGT